MNRPLISLALRILYCAIGVYYIIAGFWVRTFDTGFPLRTNYLDINNAVITQIPFMQTPWSDIVVVGFLIFPFAYFVKDLTHLLTAPFLWIGLHEFVVLTVNNIMDGNIPWVFTTLHPLLSYGYDWDILAPIATIILLAKTHYFHYDKWSWTLWMAFTLFLFTMVVTDFNVGLSPEYWFAHYGTTILFSIAFFMSVRTTQLGKPNKVRHSELIL